MSLKEDEGTDFDKLKNENMTLKEKLENAKKENTRLKKVSSYP